MKMIKIAWIIFAVCILLLTGCRSSAQAAHAAAFQNIHPIPSHFILWELRISICKKTVRLSIQTHCFLLANYLLLFAKQSLQ